MRRLCGLRTTRSNGYRWSVGSANTLKSVRTLDTADPLQRDFFRAASPDDVFLDVGANFGSWTVPAVAGPSRVRRAYALEPAPGPYLALLENLRLNACEDRVWALPVVAANREGFARFRVDTLDPSTGTSHVTSESEETHRPTGALWTPEPIETLVPTFSLDALLRMGAIEAPTLVKIDTEGHEGLVLQGMARTAVGVRRMFVEIHPDRLADGSDVVSLLARIERLGFRVVKRDQRGRQIHVLCERE